MFPDGRPSASQLVDFIKHALKDSTNLQHLNVDGSVSKASVKVLYEGQTGAVFNSVLANDLAERGGSEVGTIDRTKLGQFLFRSDIQRYVEGEIDFKSLNALVSYNFVRQNPVDKVIALMPDEASRQSTFVQDSRTISVNGN